MKNKYNKAAGLLAFLAILTSCNKTKSYTELLNEEEEAANWFLAGQTIVTSVPSDGKFEIGQDAPYYKMNKEGSVYMQVINVGDENSKPKKGDKVYYRFKYCDIKEYYRNGVMEWIGNADNLEYRTTSFFYGNSTLTSTTQLGEGIQIPLDYLNYESEVNLIIKSQMGAVDNQSLCIPYLYNIKYFKAVY